METESISDNQNDLKQHKLEHDTVDTKIINQTGRRASLSLKKQPGNVKTDFTSLNICLQ